MNEECRYLNESEILSSSTLKITTMRLTQIMLITTGKSAIHISFHMEGAALLIRAIVMTN
jgi:hypothetical protein